MMKMMILALSNMMNINFINLTHPMSMLVFIVMQTMFIGLMTGMMMESFWLSYILFMMFLGGMLVLFIYITSIASNEMFSLSFNILIFNLILWNILLIMLTIINKMMFIDVIKNTESMNFNKLIQLSEMTMSLQKLYNNPNFTITIMMMLYLFLTLMVVVKITNINKGPIRKMT
uniref:NADH-ubiquinone oxidoreductase chain 6 n=1 Tax=Apalacris nigrogeniculata TaxID=335052 RepID=A0A6G6A6N4_9ORTH|nr:NADH dehydrogenase subunit 6 [Apalacris nigrogeniculata]YP_010703646.1 NADH dehydrogenase subunit 6 [Xenocatantops humilis]QID03457.1 NADH dehydrogenase subunit 6 [Apalacris nigrogeniculata]WCO86780.1 NADH dehydrogenase subunit 6 [Xenocatantops humilis]